ncbi:MAG: hypothetical protein RL536_95 [Candidatus Parcubacteria bacterium]|jgi:ABC-type iron transport system FetAB permease component
MQQLNVRRTALTLGSFVAFIHLVWSVLLALGWAKPLADFILALHHIQISYSLAPFSFGTAVALIIVTFVLGYIFGFVFATGWNMCKKH